MAARKVARPKRSTSPNARLDQPTYAYGIARSTLGESLGGDVRQCQPDVHEQELHHPAERAKPERRRDHDRFRELRTVLPGPGGHDPTGRDPGNDDLIAEPGRDVDDLVAEIPKLLGPEIAQVGGQPIGEAMMRHPSAGAR